MRRKPVVQTPEYRLGKCAEIKRKRRAAETPQQSADRLAAKRARYSAKRASETPQQKIERLAAKQAANRARYARKRDAMAISEVSVVSVDDMPVDLNGIVSQHDCGSMQLKCNKCNA